MRARRRAEVGAAAGVVRDTRAVQDTGAVRPLTARDTRAAGTLLTASHADYPAFRHVFPDRRQRDRVLRPFLRATVADAADVGCSAAAWDAGELVGVALWLPPGAFPWSTRRKLRATPALARAALAAPRAFGAFARIGAAAESARPAEPYWCLETLGIAPLHQGQGWGSRLVQAGLVLADATKLPCYVETSDPRNATFYERHGFVVTEPALGYLPDGPAYLRLRRAPRTSPPVPAQSG